MIEACIIAPTASGKSALSLEIASRFNCRIFSIDSLSIYKEIDIASAKPTKEELASVIHYGIDVYTPDTACNVSKIIDLYKTAKEECLKDGVNLLVVGGSLFFLKTMIEGLTPDTRASLKTKELIQKEFISKGKGYEFLSSIDLLYASKIKPNDTYRIQRGLEIYFTSLQRPSDFFANNKRVAPLKNALLYEIATNKDVLLGRIEDRTKKMLELGVIDEVCRLEFKYGRNHMYAKAIGIKEVFEYLDGRIRKDELQNLITTHTAQYAKRQKTFARTQFKAQNIGTLEEIRTSLHFLFHNS